MLTDTEQWAQTRRHVDLFERVRVGGIATAVDAQGAKYRGAVLSVDGEADDRSICVSVNGGRLRIPLGDRHGGWFGGLDLRLTDFRFEAPAHGE